MNEKIEQCRKEIEDNLESWKRRSYAPGGFGGFHIDHYNRLIYESFKNLYEYINTIVNTEKHRHTDV